MSKRVGRFTEGARSVLFTLLVAAMALRAAACSSKSSSNGGTSNPSGNDGSVTTTGDASTADTGPATTESDAGADASLPPPFDAASLFVDAPPPSIDPASLVDSGTYLGAFVDILNPVADAATDEASEDRFIAAEELIGRKWRIDNRFYDDSTEFVSDRTQWDKTNQIVPMITWMPYGNGDPLTEIIEGVHDAAILAEAQNAKALGVQIFMRWGHEMNGNWYPWAGYVNGEGGSADGGLDDAGVPSSGGAKYIAAWRHVHDIFTQAGATNVFWVWCPNAQDVPEVPWNHWTNYYPGDDYVDWVGIDAYNWGTSSSCCVWQSLATILTGSPYQDYAGKKPLILPETASAEVGGDKAQWIDDMRSGIKTEFSAIRAVVWFDINKETDWRVNSSAATLAAYTAMGHDPFFNP